MNARTPRRTRANRPTSRPTIGRWKLYTMMAAAFGVLVAGTFVAARQHFLSWDYGMKNSRLRKQIDELETEKRRLLLARENSSSPSEIKRVAKKFGFSVESDVTETGIELASAKTPLSSSVVTSPKVTKTADTRPVTFAVVPASLKTSSPPVTRVAAAKPARESRRDMAE